MAAESKGKNRASAVKRGGDIFPAPPPGRSIPVAGSFVAHYTAWGGSGATWAPQSTIVEAKFDKLGGVHGIIHRNPRGTSIGTIVFRGEYALHEDNDLGTVSGTANFDLVDAHGVLTRRQELYLVRRNPSEIFFLVGKSFAPVLVKPQDPREPPYFVLQQVDTGATVEGVFYKTD